MLKHKLVSYSTWSELLSFDKIDSPVLVRKSCAPKKEENYKISATH